jgi:hypothetical protein
MRYDRRHTGTVPHRRVDWFVDDVLTGAIALLIIIGIAWLAGAVLP